MEVRRIVAFDQFSHRARVALLGGEIDRWVFARHPEQVSGFIIQNGNAYEEGLGKFWDPFRAYWSDQTPGNRAALAGFLITTLIGA